MRVGREPVVRAALQLLDRVGLEGFTLRKVAAEIGVQAPTLYWRFRNKQDLVDEMATQVLLDVGVELVRAPIPKAWAELTRLVARTLRAALLRYRDGARMVAGTRVRNPEVYRVMEASLRVFADQGIAPGEAALCFKTVTDFVIGFTIEQQAVAPKPGERTPGYEPETRDAAIDPELHPLSRSLSPAMFDDYDRTFEEGLDLIVMGFAQRIARGADANRRDPPAPEPSES
jgi:AcrR family transcriptional regulator